MHAQHVAGQVPPLRPSIRTDMAPILLRHGGVRAQMLRQIVAHRESLAAERTRMLARHAVRRQMPDHFAARLEPLAARVARPIECGRIVVGGVQSLAMRPQGVVRLERFRTLATAKRALGRVPAQHMIVQHPFRGERRRTALATEASQRLMHGLLMVATAARRCKAALAIRAAERRRCVHGAGWCFGDFLVGWLLMCLC